MLGGFADIKEVEKKDKWNAYRFKLVDSIYLFVVVYSKNYQFFQTFFIQKQNLCFLRDQNMLNWYFVSLPNFSFPTQFTNSNIPPSISRCLL